LGKVICKRFSRQFRYYQKELRDKWEEYHGKKLKVKFGKKDVLPIGEFDPKKSKVKISLLLDGDLFRSLQNSG